MGRAALETFYPQLVTLAGTGTADNQQIGLGHHRAHETNPRVAEDDRK